MDLQKEKEIIEACKKDLSAFGDIYDAYFQDVYRYSYSLTNNKNRAEEATSECFFKALGSIKKYEFKGKSIKCWLFVILRNIIYKGSQGNDLESLELNQEVYAEGDSVLDQIISDENSGDLVLKLNSLNKIEKEVVLARIWEEYKFEEISQIMGYSLSKTKMLYYRAVNKLRV